MSANLKLKVILSKNDALSFRNKVQLNSTSFGIAFGVGILACITILVDISRKGLSYNTVRQSFSESYPMFLFVGFAIFLTIITNVKNSKNIEKIFGDNEYKEIEYFISNFGIIMTSDNTEKNYPWKSIVLFEESKNDYHIHVADKQILLVPKVAFSSEAEINQFIGFVESKLEVKKIKYRIKTLKDFLKFMIEDD